MFSRRAAEETAQSPSFQSGGDVARLPLGVAALVFPVPYAGGRGGDPSVWQAVAGYRFPLFSALSLSAGPDGRVTYGASAQPLRCVVRSLQLSGMVGSCGASSAKVLTQLHQLGIRFVILGPGTPHADAVAAYVHDLATGPAAGDEGVRVWSVAG